MTELTPIGSGLTASEEKSLTVKAIPLAVAYVTTLFTLVFGLLVAEIITGIVGFSWARSSCSACCAWGESWPCFI